MRIKSPELHLDEPYQINLSRFVKNQNWKREPGHGNEINQQAVYNVLDAVLVNTMERLKKMRCA